MKKLILTLIILISSVSINKLYAEQFWYEPYKMSAYKYPMSNDNKLFEGNTNDVICIDSTKGTITIYGRDEIDVFYILHIKVQDNENKRIDFYTKDDKNKNNVRVTTHTIDNNKQCIIAFTYPYGTIIYYVNFK